MDKSIDVIRQIDFDEITKENITKDLFQIFRQVGNELLSRNFQQSYFLNYSNLKGFIGKFNKSSSMSIDIGGIYNI